MPALAARDLLIFCGFQSPRIEAHQVQPNRTEPNRTEPNRIDPRRIVVWVRPNSKIFGAEELGVFVSASFSWSSSRNVIVCFQNTQYRLTELWTLARNLHYGHAPPKHYCLTGKASVSGRLWVQIQLEAFSLNWTEDVLDCLLAS